MSVQKYVSCSNNCESWTNNLSAIENSICWKKILLSWDIFNVNVVKGKPCAIYDEIYWNAIYFRTFHFHAVSGLQSSFESEANDVINLGLQYNISDSDALKMV